MYSRDNILTASQGVPVRVLKAQDMTRLILEIDRKKPEFANAHIDVIVNKLRFVIKIMLFPFQLVEG